MKTNEQAAAAFNKAAADVVTKSHTKKNNSTDQHAAAEMRETATNEEMIAAAAGVDKPAEKPADNEPKEITWRNYCIEEFETAKINALYRVAVNSLSAGVEKYFGEKYGEDFALKLFAAADEKTHDFTWLIVDKVSDEIREKDPHGTTWHEIISAGEIVAYSVKTDKPTTAAAINVVFNSYLTTAIRYRFASVQAITAEREREKAAAAVEKIAAKINVDSFAAIIKQNPELAAALLERLK